MQILERIKEKTEQIDLNKKIRDTHQENRVNLSDNVNTGKSRFYKRFQGSQNQDPLTSSKQERFDRSKQHIDVKPHQSMRIDS